MQESLIKISNLKKYFDDENNLALDAINAEFSSGKIIGLIGPDGAGKTTLIRIMAGLLKPSFGNVEILKYDTILNSEKIHQLISYMPQRFGLYEDLTVEQNLNLYADLFFLTKEEKKERFSTLLQFTILSKFTKRLARNLSGGMKQKLGLACTLLRKPKFLLLDEPSVGVDPISRRELWSMVASLTKENISVLWSTSYLDEAEKCQEVLVLNQGKMLYYGSPKELTDKLKKRTYQIVKITTDRRSVLQKVLKDEKTIDGVIQGNAVRVVLKSLENKIDISKFDAGREAELIEVEPRFEDAFMDLLGGGPKEASPLINIVKDIEKSEKPLVEVKNIVKKFGNFTAVNDISFSVKGGEIFGLLGPNGAGKSTTFKMLCGLLKPTQGDAIISGLSLSKVKSEARAQIGYMAQKFSLYDNMSVFQNLKFFSGIYPETNDKKSDIINQMIKIFDLVNYKNTKPFELPLGFKQRLALSCAIMHSPIILFLDEPTSGVDPITRREFWNHINALVKKGVSIIITTHFMDEAEYCDRIALINQGNIIKIGSPDNLKSAVASEKLPIPTLEDAFVILSSQSENING
ncbi:MAG: ABC transporter ATP-binding protein [Parachlamydiales bacterium]|nr:ABC transporter ATP-binding protein [Parachlamydiales bacterium]